MNQILGVNVVPTTYEEVIEKTLRWARNGDSRALVFANVHVIMEAFDDPSFREQLNAADVVAADGVPLVWVLRLLGFKRATRVYGPDCTVQALRAAAEAKIPVGFYGGSQKVLEAIQVEAKRQFPELDISVAISPPFRPLTQQENDGFLKQIAESKARFLFVGLGCPKQERWMMENYRKLPVVIFAVGAAFDFIAGSKAQAPRWMMRLGLEWLFRLATEPRRLLRRYLKHNPRFVFYSLQQILTQRTH